jgi:hypothetical protein
MSAVQVHKTTAAPAGDANGIQAESLEQRFRRLESLWNAETGHLSSATKIMNHPAFREIVGLGEAVVPLMLRDLQEQPRLWVWALPEITGVNPLATQDAGNIGKMSETWLCWAKEHGYQW